MISQDKLTIKGQEIIQKASQLASENNNQELTNAHILLAMLEVSDTAIAPIVQK